jgi:acyl dehydratase
VPAGSRIRGRFRVAAVEPVPPGHRVTIDATVECEGVEKPVCVAELLLLTLS